MFDIDWKPDKNSHIPLYKQVVDYIKRKIGKGEWDIGSKLPTQRELSKIFNVNRSTVVEALEELKSEGLIEGKGGNGTIIINNTWSLLASNSPHNWGKYIKGGIHKPNLPIIQSINKLEYKENIIRLGTGELSKDLFPNEKMKLVLNSVSNNINSLGYEEPKGSLKLRQTISNYLKKYKINVSPDCILIVSGSLQALQLISIGILYSGSTVLIEKPSYIKSLYLFQSAGMKLKGISINNEGINIKEIVENANKSTSILYTIPTFHNPTGIIVSENKRREILKVCEELRLPIIEDDAYRELWLDEEPPMPIKSIDKNGSVLYMGTISKSLSAGMRIGWLVGPQSIIERLGDIKMQIDYGSSSISQLVLDEWITSGLYEQYLKELREKLKIRREVAINTLEKYFSNIATWNKPKGGFYIWLKLKKPVCIKDLFSVCCDNNILINPGEIYDFNKNSNIRISYSYASLDDLENGLKRLSQIIKKFY